MIIKEIEAKNVITKSNLPVCDFSVNPYTGCSHACKYCYASFMKRFSNHPEPWGEFIDVKIWDKIKNPKNISSHNSKEDDGGTEKKFTSNLFHKTENTLFKRITIIPINENSDI